MYTLIRRWASTLGRGAGLRPHTVRKYLTDHLCTPGPDPVEAFIGSFDADPDLSASVDDVIYGGKK